MEKHKGRWRVMQDDRLREVMIFSGGKEKIIQVRGYDSAVEVGRYMAAVGQFLADNDPRFLEPFKGRSVIDAGQGRPTPWKPARTCSTAWTRLAGLRSSRSIASLFNHWRF